MKINLDPIWEEPVQQQVFRGLLTAMSRPGQVVDISEHLAGHPTFLVVLATLVDGMVSLSDPHKMIGPEFWPLLQAKRAGVGKAGFVTFFGHQAPPRDFDPQLGELASPESGATLIIIVDTIGAEHDMTLLLSGPGVDGSRELYVSGLHRSWIDRREEWTKHFPLGVDLILVDAGRMAAIPRTTKVRIT
ncbi:MAG: phosphonate C-P lyase system protein PhnH [Deltaproteobacteria bacterium]|nr:phosphonate C-P lyase system protein PhnH [Deltaproteobacteria bacterium]